MKLDGSSIIQEDNKGAVDYSRKPSVTGNMRHIAQRFHYARELQQMAEIDIQHCSTKNMLADFSQKRSRMKSFYTAEGAGTLAIGGINATSYYKFRSAIRF